MARAPLLLAGILATAGLVHAQSFVNFESPQTHPIAIASDGSRLYTVNTPDNRVAVWSLLAPDRPVLIAEIAVGLEPVSVAARTADELWVVNRLSDSISVVSVAQRTVTDTIRVGDEPADVVFAGAPQVALVSVSGREAVKVIDVATHGELASIPIFGDEPRALARSADGLTVWVAAHRSGNKTTIVPEDRAPPPPPPTNPQLPPAPQSGLIVDSDDPQWTAAHGVVLPDWDVFEIDVATRAVARRYSGVGTTLFNIAVHPARDELWVANTEARNLVRFEPNLRGHIVDSRLTRIATGAVPQVSAFDLNPGIDYGVLPNPAAQASALAQPTDVAFAPGGQTLWVAAFGTDRIGVVDGNGAVTGFVELGVAGAPTQPRQKRGPRGLAMHPTAPRAYVLNRLSMTLGVLDTGSRTVLRELPLGHDPTPDQIKSARGFLYDAKLSGNGTASCASCHADGEIDGLAWDLGDPGGVMQTVFSGGVPNQIHPMKGPMTTQTLRGLTPDTAPFHWRGDRATLQDFNQAFDKLLGGDELSATEMDDYASFLETLAFPPNPNQPLDRTFSTTPIGVSATAGFNFFRNIQFIPTLTCATCHALPNGTSGLLIPGALLQEPQPFKVPQLRNVYKRMGRAPVGGMSISGFGLLHDGSVNDVFDLLSKPVFQSLSTQPNNKTKLQNYMREFDTGLAPTVGYGVAVDAARALLPATAADLQLLEEQAALRNCDVVAKGVFRGQPRGFALAGGVFRSDSASLGAFQLSELLAEAAAGNAVLTFVGVPPGSGTRIGIDRDADGVLDGDEGLASYGQPSPACGPQMRMDGSSAPAPGNALFALLARGAPPSSAGAVFLGIAPASLPFFDVTLLVDVTTAVTLPMASDAHGVGIAPLPLPGALSLVGATLHAQALFAAGCGQLGVALSDGLRVTIGE